MFVAPYSSDLFNTLPHLHDACSAFQARGGENAVEELLDLIDQKGVKEKFGITLLHRHFDLRKNEALVDTNGTSSAWQVDESTNASTFGKYNGRILPHSWMIQDEGKLAPYEFAFCLEASPSPVEEDAHAFDANDRHFVDSFSGLVRRLGMQDVFGLCSMRDRRQKTMEVTEGGANVTFVVGDDFDFKIDEGSKIIPAMWGFLNSGTEDGNSRPVFVRGCFQTCTGPYNAHSCNHRYTD